MSRLLVVDDEPTICWGLTVLAEGLGHQVVSASSAEQALAAAHETPPDAIFLDVRLPGIDGLQAMRQFRSLLGSVPIVVMTAYGDLGIAVEAVRQDAFEYLVKPFDLQVAQRVLERSLLAQADAAQERLSPDPFGEAGLVGRSQAMQQVFKLVALAAPSDANVHLQGESGVGKELLARAIHRYSRRSEGPFVAVNLASLNAALSESELFGHARGAFTGAVESHRGLLEQASGGTIFLDEAADIPLALQVKLLRALEYGEVVPVGSQQPLQVDLRIVSATHQKLQDRVADGSFRHDLFYRLSSFGIEVPPLRNRSGDVPLLAEHFCALLADKHGLPRPQIHPEAVAELEVRPWHGNVRELRNAIERAMILSRGSTIMLEHLPEPISAATDGSPNVEQRLVELIRQWTATQLGDGADDRPLYDRLLALGEPPLL